MMESFKARMDLCKKMKELVDLYKNTPDRYNIHLTRKMFCMFRQLDPDNSISEYIQLGLDKDKAKKFFDGITHPPSKVVTGGDGWCGATLAYGKYFTMKDAEKYIDYTDDKQKYCKLKDEYNHLTCYELPCCFKRNPNEGYGKYDLFIGFLIHFLSLDSDDYDNASYTELMCRETAGDMEMNDIIHLKSYPLLNDLWTPILTEKYSDTIRDTNTLLDKNCEFCLLPSDCTSCS
jgi:hypothetical protein